MGYLFYPLFLLGCHEFLGELLQKKKTFKIIFEWSFNGGTSTSFVSMTRQLGYNTSTHKCLCSATDDYMNKTSWHRVSPHTFPGFLQSTHIHNRFKKPMNEWTTPTAERLVVLWEMSKHWSKTSLPGSFTYAKKYPLTNCYFDLQMSESHSLSNSALLSLSVGSIIRAVDTGQDTVGAWKPVGSIYDSWR